MSLEISDEIKNYWNAFIESNPHLEYLRDYKFEAWSFGFTSETADNLVKLVLEGKKVATCSLLRAYRGEENEIPRVGIYSIICDGKKSPQCVVFYTDTFICKFNEVTETHAREEGEGDQTLAYWQKVHREFFSAYGNFQDDEDLLCERFRVVYK